MPQSLTQQLDEIYAAWRGNRPAVAEVANNSWVTEVFEDSVVIDESGTFYRVSYSADGDEIIFADRSEWVEVERTAEFVEKSAKAFVRLTGKNSLKTLQKTKDDLVVGNYIVLFGDEDRRDLEEEWFTEKTALESPFTQTGILHVDFDHGHGKDIYGGVGPGKHDILGVVKWETAKMDEMGVWVERVLNLRNKYMEYIEPLVTAGMVGTSSKAIAERVRISKDGEIKTWPLERDTLTVIPAEPRMMTDNAISALKSLVTEFPKLKEYLPEEPGSGSGADSTPKEKSAPKQKTLLEVKSMKTKKEFLAFYAEKMGKEVEDLTDKDKAFALNGTEFAVVDDPKDDPVYATKQEVAPLQESIDELSKSVADILRYAQEEKPFKGSGYISETGGKSDEKSYNFGDFLVAVARDDRQRLKTIYKSVWREDEKTDMSHIDGVGGGYTIPGSFETNILKMSEDMSPIQQMVQKVPVGSNRGKYPALDQFTAPTAGVGDTAFAGKVTAASTPENTALTETRPEFKMIEYNIHKIGGYTEVPNELINDSPVSIENLLNSLFAIVVNNKIEYSIFRGTGANEPLGILNSSALIAFATITNNVFALKDAAGMLSRFKPFMSNGAFFMHPGVTPDLAAFEAGTGGSVYIMDQKNDPMIGQPILGKPVYLSEHLPQDDNSGDVILADLKAYLLFIRKGLEIAFSDHVSFKSNQGVWRFTQRMDGQPWLTSTITLADPQGSYTVSPFVKHHD